MFAQPSFSPDIRVDFKIRELEINSMRRNDEVILFSGKAQNTELGLSLVSIFGT